MSQDNQEGQPQEGEIVEPESNEGPAYEENQEPESAPQDDADFLGGFESANGVEVAPEPEPEKLFGKYTEEQVAAWAAQSEELAKIREREAKVFGTLGSLKQSIDQLRERPQSPQINAALTRMSAEYPELAEVLRADLAELSPGAAAVDPQAIERLVNERLEAASKQTAQQFLTIMHSDWREIPGSPEFEQWKASLTADELQTVNDSWDVEAVNKSLSKFKAWKSESAQAKQSRQSRLEAAITPPRGRAQPTPSQSEDDAFLAGFKSAKAGQ